MALARRCVGWWLAALACGSGCAVAAADADAGRETGACIDGECFDDLQCLSDLCVSPDGTGESGISTSEASTTSAGSSAGPSGTSNPSGETDLPTNPTVDPSVGETTMGPDSETAAESSESSTGSEGNCNADILLVVDNSASMAPYQDRVATAIGSFVDALENEFAGSSLHVGVITSDAYTLNPPGCTALGDLVTRNSSGADCGPFAGGLRFATDADDLGDALSCMAQVGTTGSFIEQPVTGAIEALSDAKAEAGACNEGFLRDGARLGVFIVTDDTPYEPDLDDAHLTTDTSGWYDAVIAAKDGDASAVAVTGIIPVDDVSCVFQQAASPNLIGFIAQFGPQGLSTSVCDANYAPALTAGVEMLAAGCEA